MELGRLHHGRSFSISAGRFRFSAQPDRHPDGALQREPKPGLRRRFLLGRADGAPGWRGDFGSGGGHCDWIGHDCRSGVYTADYFAGAALGPVSVQERGGTLDRTIPPCNNASRSTQAASFTWPPWTSLSITGLGRMPAPCSRIVIHCAKTDCPTRSRPATTPRDVRATPKSNIFGRRTSGTFGPRSRTPLAGSSLRRTRSNRVRRRARLPAALSSVKTPGSGDANGRVGSEQ